MLEPGASSASLSLSGAVCAAGAWLSSLQCQHSVCSPARGTGLCLCGTGCQVQPFALLQGGRAGGTAFVRAGLRRFLLGHLVLQAPGAAVATSGACDSACRYILTLPIPLWDVVVVWSWCPSPCLGGAGFGTVGSVPLVRDLSPLWGPGHAGQGCGAKAELWHGHRAGHGLWKVPVSPHLTAGVCCRLRWVQGEEMAPVGRAHAATGSPFASEEPGGNC